MVVQYWRVRFRSTAAKEIGPRIAFDGTGIFAG